MSIVIAIFRVIATVFDLFLIVSTIMWSRETPNIRRRRTSAIIAISLFINLLFATSIL